MIKKKRAEDASHRILSYLRANPGEWVSGKSMGDELGVSRAAIWKHVRYLRSLGYRIEASPRLGYRLLGPEPLHVVASGMWKRLIPLESVGSTNDFARDIASESESGTVVIAEVQTSGRGRLGRSWLSPAGGIWMSVILKPNAPPTEAFRATMAASVAVCKALSSLYGLEARIKWPNDVLLNNKKVCGILTEISAELDVIKYVVIGIGINANIRASEFPEEWNATSISEELGREVSRNELISKILEELELSLKSEDLYQDWVHLSATLGRRVRVYGFNEVIGVAESLGSDGSLMVRMDDGTLVKILAGDCMHLRTSDLVGTALNSGEVTRYA